MSPPGDSDACLRLRTTSLERPVSESPSVLPEERPKHLELTYVHDNNLEQISFKKDNIQFFLWYFKII